MAGGADEGAGDDPAHAVLAHQDFPGDAAILIQGLQGHHVLMGGDLEHGVGGGVDDQVAGLAVLIAVLLNDLRAGPGSIGQYTPAGGLPEGLQHLLRESVGIGGQRLGGYQAGNFPVADGGVLTGGQLLDAAVSAVGWASVGR